MFYTGDDMSDRMWWRICVRHVILLKMFAWEWTGVGRVEPPDTCLTTGCSSDVRYSAAHAANPLALFVITSMLFKIQLKLLSIPIVERYTNLIPRTSQSHGCFLTAALCMDAYISQVWSCNRSLIDGDVCPDVFEPVSVRRASLSVRELCKRCCGI